MTHDTGQWIRVKNKMPLNEQKVWFGRKGSVLDGIFLNSKFAVVNVPREYIDEYSLDEVNYWQPMQVPAPPEEE